MGLCALLYVIGFILSAVGNEPGAGRYDPLIQSLGLIPSRGSVLTWFSHMFIHGGFFHLIGNMLYLFLFGSVVEDTLGRSKFLAFYLIGGLVAAGIYLLVTGMGSNVPMVGASGAISACLGGFVVFYSRTQIEFRYLIWFLIYVRSGTFYLVSWVVVSAWFVWDLGAMVLRMRSGAEGGGVAFAAHVGGMLGGFAMVAARQRWTRTSEKKSETVKVRTVSPRNVHIYHNEAELGPYSKEQVRQMIAAGTLDSGSLYWMEGMLEWLPVCEL